MTTYADPTRCPDCHSLLPEAPQVCGRCALPLTGPTAVELFTTLQQADRLLATLRHQGSPADPAPLAATGTGARSAAAQGSMSPTPGSLLADVAPYPAPGHEEPGRRPGRADAPRLPVPPCPRSC